jgi:site-specific recombinase XerD
MLKHACGHALANKGHDTRALQAYLGHRNIQHTVRYTELSPLRFKDFLARLVRRVVRFHPEALVSILPALPKFYNGFGSP